MPFTPWQRPDALALTIRACARRIAALNKLRTQTKNQLHAARQHRIEYFDVQIEPLRQQVLDLAAADESLQQHFDLLVSGTGIAATSASPSTCPHSAPLAMILT